MQITHAVFLLVCFSSWPKFQDYHVAEDNNPFSFTSRKDQREVHVTLKRTRLAIISNVFRRCKAFVKKVVDRTYLSNIPQVSNYTFYKYCALTDCATGAPQVHSLKDM